jgi:hypothetical protein
MFLDFKEESLEAGTNSVAKVVLSTLASQLPLCPHLIREGLFLNCGVVGTQITQSVSE